MKDQDRPWEKQAEAGQDPMGRVWPAWVRGLVSAVVAFHLVAIVTAAFAAPPSSELQRWAADHFARYYQLFDMNHAYRFYTDGPPPTPILRARLQFDDGREEEIRIPDRSQKPRLRFQRHLALAYHLFEEHRRASAARQESRWARSYARHLCRLQVDEGCVSVSLYLQMHMNPSPAEMYQAALRGESIDVEADRYYDVPRQIGAYSCDDF
ncbi:hypothetical protein BH23PLA1_BH23PLA1_38930 [soil metagenome]